MASHPSNFPASFSVHPIAVEQCFHHGNSSRSPQCLPFRPLPSSSVLPKNAAPKTRKGRHIVRAECEDGVHCKVSEKNSSLLERPLEDERDPQNFARQVPTISCFASSQRRSLLISLAGVATLSCGLGNALAIKQTLLAGRIPGLSPPDANGLRTYRRPDAKSGGHGVGWSPIIPYTFQVPEEWEEVPVSIADLGGAEIDLRFSSKQAGNLSVVVAPVQRFASDLGDDARIENVGPPEKVIDAFGPEVIGQNVEGQVKDMEITEHDGRKYYIYELNAPHVMVTATAAGNRIYLMTVSGNGRQWKKYHGELKQIAGSFRVG